MSERGKLRRLNRPPLSSGLRPSGALSPYPVTVSDFRTMTGEWQIPPGADVILRASGGKELHVHKLVLSLASSVFRDMFSVPQPPPTDSSQLPIIDVSDPPEALELFLQTIYPTRNPLMDDVKKLASVLHLVDKYDARDVLDVHKDYLPSTFGDLPPIQIYAILCACGREEEAGAAARRVSFASLQTLDSNPLLQLITTTQYQRLLSFMTSRDKRMREIVDLHHKKMGESHYRCSDSDASHALYPRTVVAVLQAAFEADPFVPVVKALGLVTSASRTFQPCRDDCKYSATGLLKYAEGLLGELVEMAQNLSWEDPHKEKV